MRKKKLKGGPSIWPFYLQRKRKDKMKTKLCLRKGRGLRVFFFKSQKKKQKIYPNGDVYTSWREEM